jgi:hypothetical protein
MTSRSATFGSAPAAALAPAQALRYMIADAVAVWHDNGVPTERCPLTNVVRRLAGAFPNHPHYRPCHLSYPARTLTMVKFKSGHCGFQIQPLGVKPGQYLVKGWEHASGLILQAAILLRLPLHT